MIEVVILPGLDGTARLLEGVCVHLREQGLPTRAITYPPDQVLGYAELELIVRSQLPLHRFVLVGESFSGPLAIRIAADPPAGLAGLVLSTSFARNPVPALAPLAGLVQLAPSRPPMPLLSWGLLGPWATATLRNELAQALRQVDPSVLRARAAAALRTNVLASASRIQIPVLQLVAEHDRLLPRAVSHTLANALTSCDTITLPGPHLLLQTSPQVCAQEISRFALGLDFAAHPQQPLFRA